MAAIVLAALNARYAHTSLALRCLRANLGELRAASTLREFTIGRPTGEIVDRIVAALDAHGPRLVGLSVCIWNVEPTARVIAQLKARAPEVAIVIGGPEVSHEIEAQPICALADYVVTGWGEVTFARLAREILSGPRPSMKVHAGERPPLAALVPPYDEYTDDDLRHRHVYVEASRGCPFKCEFCLSALDATAWPFPLETFVAQLDRLWSRGARRFRFIDRTFNLNAGTSAAILRFFLERIDAAPDDLPFVHFELIADHLPDRLREPIARFPSGVLQFEIGIQTWNPQVQRLISRRQDNAAAERNLRWLRDETRAHLHVDLIAGLPGEDIDSFGSGFDRLVALRPHEIQVGILKRLRGAPIARHTQAYGLLFNPAPPYDVLATDRIDAATMQRLARFARYWDLIANSGRFARTLPLVLGAAPFARFMALADWMHEETGRTHGIALEALFALLYRWLARQMPAAQAARHLGDDYAACGARGRLPFLPVRPPVAGRAVAAAPAATPPRQARHLRQ